MQKRGTQRKSTVFFFQAKRLALFTKRLSQTVNKQLHVVKKHAMYRFVIVGSTLPAQLFFLITECAFGQTSLKLRVNNKFGT